MGRVPRSNSKTQAFLIGWPLTTVGGVSEVVRNLARAFSNSGPLKPLIIEACESGAPASPCDGVPLIRVPLVSPWAEEYRLKALLAFVLKLPLLLWRWAAICRAYNIAVLNAHFIGPEWFCLMLARRLGIFRGSLILSFHGSDLRDLVQSCGLPLFLSRMLLRGADWLVPCSNALGEQLRQFLPDCKAQIVPVRNGIDAQRFLSSADQSFELPEHFRTGTRVVSIGAFRPVKGHDVLLRSFSQLHSAGPDLRLIIAGGSGPEFCATERLVHTLGLQKDVLLIRDLEHAKVPTLLQQADLFVLSSRNEGFPMVLLEAGAAGTPLVATEACGVAELITNGETGWTVPVDRPDLLARAMEDALSNPQERTRRAANLRARVLAEFSWSRAHLQYLGLASRKRESKLRIPQTTGINIQATEPRN